MTDDADSEARGALPPPATGDDLSLLGHDIRAAISDIVGGLRLIDAEALPAPQRAQIGRIRVAGDALAALVDEALMRAAGEDGDRARDRDRAGRFSLQPYLEDVAARWSANAVAAEATFRLERDEGLPPALALDRLALDRIVSNLLFNAVKYCDGREIVLRVYPGRSGGVCICVRDRGPGFSPEAMQRLFQRGGRPAGSRPGSGLGLHVAWLQAEAIGAAMSVRSPRDGGAEVVLHLPAEAVRDDAGDVADLPDLSDLRILLAEDNATSQLLIGGMLRRMGAAVEVVADGLAAADALAAQRFDLALLDIEMPRLSGMDLIAARKREGSAPPPLVALTAYVLRANRDAIFAAGADGIIAKPVASAADFGQAVRRHVDYAANRPEADWPAEPAAVADALTAFDEARFRDLMAAAGPEDGPELSRRLTADLRSVDRALAQADPRGQAAEIRAQTHILIALAGAVGAARLQHRAERLNRVDKGQKGTDGAHLLALVREDIATLLARLGQSS